MRRIPSSIARFSGNRGKFATSVWWKATPATPSRPSSTASKFSWKGLLLNVKVIYCLAEEGGGSVEVILPISEEESVQCSSRSRNMHVGFVLFVLTFFLNFIWAITQRMCVHHIVHTCIYISIIFFDELKKIVCFGIKISIFSHTSPIFHHQSSGKKRARILFFYFLFKIFLLWP